MILDEIIAVFFSILEPLFGFFFEGITLFFSVLINFFILIIELIVGLFITGFTMKKIKPYKRKKGSKETNDYNEYNQTQEPKPSFSDNKLSLFVIVGIFVAAFVLVPKFIGPSYYELTFVATDGHSLPFASVVIYRNGSEEHRRTKNDGHLRIEKTGLDKIVLNDKRYVKTTWKKSEIKDILVVKRTLLGSGVDILAKKLLSGNSEK